MKNLAFILLLIGGWYAIFETMYFIHRNSIDFGDLFGIITAVCFFTYAWWLAGRMYDIPWRKIAFNYGSSNRRLCLLPPF